MTPVLKSEYRILSGNPTLTTIAQDERAPLQTIIARGNTYANKYDIYLCDDIRPVASEYQTVTRNPIEEWDYSDTPKVTYTVTDISLEELRETKLQEVTDMRWQIMTGGVTLPGGIRVATTIEDQNRITSVVANAALVGLGDDDEVDFKAESGWAKVTIAQVKGIASAVGQLVQACYTAERAHSEAIDLLETREAIAAYDITTGWPS